MGIFKIVIAKGEQEYSTGLTKSTFSFFIPGVNSGVYHPATLCIQAKIVEYKSTIFGKLHKHTSADSIILSTSEFDDLYNEMTKIKELRDNKIFQK